MQQPVHVKTAAWILGTVTTAAGVAALLSSPDADRITGPLTDCSPDPHYPGSHT